MLSDKERRRWVEWVASDETQGGISGIYIYLHTHGNVDQAIVVEGVKYWVWKFRLHSIMTGEPVQSFDQRNDTVWPYFKIVYQV
jgi:hypothetical protein